MSLESISAVEPTRAPAGESPTQPPNYAAQREQIKSIRNEEAENRVEPTLPPNFSSESPTEKPTGMPN